MGFFFFLIVEEIEDNNSSESLEINLIMSRTKVNPAADFSNRKGAPIRAKHLITVELQQGSPLVFSLDSEQEQPGASRAQRCFCGAVRAEGVSRRMLGTMPGAAPLFRRCPAGGGAERFRLPVAKGSTGVVAAAFCRSRSDVTLLSLAHCLLGNLAEK